MCKQYLLASLGTASRDTRFDQLFLQRHCILEGIFCQFSGVYSAPCRLALPLLSSVMVRERLLTIRAIRWSMPDWPCFEPSAGQIQRSLSCRHGGCRCLFCIPHFVFFFNISILCSSLWMGTPCLGTLRMSAWSLSGAKFICTIWVLRLSGNVTIKTFRQKELYDYICWRQFSFFIES